MFKEKRVLLIAGGGALGTYTAEELLHKGHFVDVICLEDNTSSGKLNFYKEEVNDENLTQLFKENRYDAIVDFMQYADAEAWKSRYSLLMKNTEHLVFLSSYRVYADSDAPITESSPKLIDVIEDESFLQEEKYAIPKSECERFLQNECKGEHWTVVRPVISFWHKRFDLVMYSNMQVLECAKAGEEIILPERTRNLTAGFDWAKNSGKLIANLLFKSETYGECYTVSSAQNLTWGEIAEIYSKLLGLKVRWTDEEEFLKHPMFKFKYKMRGYFYDRIYDRRIDNSKILKATGLKKEDFSSIKDGLKTEIEKAKGEE